MIIDRTLRQLRLGRRSGPNPVNIHDTYRLDTASMRFEAAFTRVKNNLISTTNARMLDALCALHRAGADPASAPAREPARGVVRL